MDLNEAKRIYENAKIGYAEAVEEVRKQDHRVDAFLDIMSGLETLFPDHDFDFEAPPRRGEKPKGSQAVRPVLVTNPHHEFMVADMVEELRARGWLPNSPEPANAVRMALDRLVTAEPEHFVKRPNAKAKTVYVFAPTDKGA